MRDPDLMVDIFIVNISVVLKMLWIKSKNNGQLVLG